LPQCAQSTLDMSSGRQVQRSQRQGDTDIAGTSDESVLSWHKAEGKKYFEMSVNIDRNT